VAWRGVGLVVRLGGLLVGGLSLVRRRDERRDEVRHALRTDELPLEEVLRGLDALPRPDLAGPLLVLAVRPADGRLQVLRQAPDDAAAPLASAQAARRVLAQLLRGVSQSRVGQPEASLRQLLARSC